MTKSTITRERAQQIFLGNGPEPSASEERELARMALAAMDSEPDYKERKLFCSTDTARMRKVISASAGSEATPLYRHAQPVPVVPNGLRLALSNAGIAAPESDEMLAATCEKHIQALVTWVKDRKPFQSAPVVPSFEEWLSAANRKPLGWVKDAMREAFDACRAAMLAAAPQSPGSEPATVPGTWIPVSERMPEDEQEVLTINRMGHRFVSFFDKHSGLYFDRLDAPAACCIERVLVTHWMPLPAAPQEVKGE